MKLLALLLPLALLRAGGPAADVPQIPFEKYTLPNGLEVILHEDHRMPEVVVDVWYKVGSKDEVAGRTGFAHLFEHVMFQGTKHVAEDKHFEYLQKAGASNVNGSTSAPTAPTTSRSCPTNQLELALWLESDRMGFLLDRPGFKETLDNQRDVVKNERRQRVENRPMGLVSKVILEAIYPPDAPLLPRGHRLDGGPLGASGRRRQGVLPHLLRARQRHADHRRRLRSRAPQGAGREVLRAHPRRSGAAPTRSPPAGPVHRRRPSGSRWRPRSSSPSSTSRTRRRPASRPATASSTWSPTCWPTASRRACTGAWSTT